MERAYTIKEIEDLRDLCSDKWLYGSFFPFRDGCSRFSRSYKPEERDKGVEELVRTYMLAGITAEDIWAQSALPAKEEG